MSRPCSVALTGGLASGKSTVATMLERRGAAAIDTDRVVHELYAPDEAGTTAVRDLFGQAAMDEQGAVDREVLASLVATDTDARHRLEAAVHPLVRRTVSDWLDRLSEIDPPPPAAVVEAALFVETGGYRLHDLLVVVWCRREQQLGRAIDRGMKPGRARALLAAQTPLGEKRAVADIVVDNSGPLEALDAEVDRAWREILDRCAQRDTD